ncbi:MAG: 3-mercaptopyruvate sulfurtransferase [Deltaproteobacteria bacterium]|nr:3-mercaptopyruvate sulfurtransferase [Deltaproteobacteria bacterium]
MPFQLNSLIESDELANHLGDQNLKIIDGSWHLRKANRDGRKEFEKEHIPGAVFLDLDELSDQDSELPHTFPTEEYFSTKIGELGVDNESWVVVYDSTGLFSAARIWWMFRTFGHHKVSLLNGGLPKWKSEGRELAKGSSKVNPVKFKAVLESGLVIDWKATQLTSQNDEAIILDARPAERFAGEVQEPRPGLRSGHIPHSRNLPFMDLLEGPYRTMISEENLKELFQKSAIFQNKEIVCSCGSGVTACILALGLHVTGHDNVKIYDGSWTEWGGRHDLPIETGS